MRTFDTVLDRRFERKQHGCGVALLTRRDSDLVTTEAGEEGIQGKRRV